MKSKTWTIDGDFVHIKYEDGDVITVTKADFNRAFQAILTTPKCDVIRDFAV